MSAPAATEFAPIRVQSAWRQVAAALLERITARELAAGHRLPSETELARQFGVNRSTVREALRELEGSGVLARERGSKLMMVTRPPRERVAGGVSRALALHDVRFVDVWEGMTLLEPPIAEAAARRRTAADLERIGAATDAFLRDRADTLAAVHAVADFFEAIGEACHNSVLMLAHEPLVQLLEPSLGAMIDEVPQARARIEAAQQKILAAIRARDADGAREWMGKHVRDFRRGYVLAKIDLERTISAGHGTRRRG